MAQELDSDSNGKIDDDLLPAFVLKTGGELTSYIETLYNHGTLTDNVTINLANGPIQRMTINKSANPLTITLPSDPGVVGKSFTLIVENAAGKTHAWGGPTIKWLSEADSDTVPTPAADTYVTVYTFTWDDNDAGTGRWLGWAAGKETA